MRFVYDVLPLRLTTVLAVMAQSGKLEYHVVWHSDRPIGNAGNDMENILYVWFSHFTLTETHRWLIYSLSLYFNKNKNSPVFCWPISVLATSKPSPLKIVGLRGDCGKAIQNDVDIDTYYCKRILISWWWINKTVFYTRFLSPTDLKCVESSTYWQFFYYRPPGKFRWTSVNHFDKQREISLKCDAKNIYVSLSLYICHTR